jgi:hypothetical protein
VTRQALVVDTETDGLHAELGARLWEVCTLDPASGEEHLWRVQLPPEALADEGALEVCHYREAAATMAPLAAPGLCDLSLPENGTWPMWSHPRKLASHLLDVLAGVTIIGAVPGFDERFLGAFLREHGYGPPYPWHYRVRDIGSMAYGWLQGRAAGAQFLAEPGSDAARDHPDIPSAVPPVDASTDDFARALGVDPGQFDRHSALGDCRLVAAMLAVIEGKPRVISDG